MGGKLTEKKEDKKTDIGHCFCISSSSFRQIEDVVEKFVGQSSARLQHKQELKVCD